MESLHEEIDLAPLIDIAVGSIINNFTFGFCYENVWIYF